MPTSDGQGRISPAWPPGDGEMVRHIREHDWAATPLGPTGDWPDRLKGGVELMLALGHPAHICVGEEWTQLYNDAYAALIGAKHPAALGQDARKTFAEVDFAEALARVFDGETVTLTDQPQPFKRHRVIEPAWFDLSSSPIRDEVGAVFAILTMLKETTRRVQAEMARDEVEAYHAFLLKLSDALRPLGNAEPVLTEAMRALGRHLRVNRAEYFEADATGSFVDRRGGFAEGLPPLLGRFLLADLGQGPKEALEAGTTFVVGDTAEPRIKNKDRSTYEATGARSAVGVPIIKNKKLVAVLAVSHREPRRWTSGELAVIEETAERVWAAVERARTEAALRESEGRFRSFAENSADVLWIVNAATRQLEYLSPSFAAMWGESRERVMADIGRWLDLVHPEDRGRAALAMQRSLDGETTTQSYRIVRPFDGAERWIQDTGFPIRDEKGRITRVGGIAQDLTERTRTEMEVRAKRRELRILVENIPQLVWRAVDGGDWIWASPQWTEFTGQSDQDSHGWGWLDPIHPDDHQAARKAWGAAQKEGRFEAEYRLRNRDGSYRWFQTRATPIHSEDGGLVEWIGTSTDIDDIRRLQAHEGLLLAELQHRVRNTLGVIRSIVRRTARTSETLEDYIMHLEARIEAFSRVQSSVTRDPRRGVDLEYLVVEELRAVGAKEGNTFTIRGPQVLMNAKAAETLGLAIHELATNAMKHGALTSPRGEIRVRWTRKSREGLRVLDFSWEEQGMRNLPEHPARRGFGTEIVTRTLGYELKARVEQQFHPTGLECHIQVPIAQLLMPGSIEALQ